MIDEKKIEEAKKSFIADKKILGIMAMNDLACGFKEGAKWAINELFKNLWHPANEEPKKVKNLLLETTYEYGKPIYHLIKYMPNGNNVCAWREWYKGAHISRWLYIDDLLPKEGGNHD